MGNSNSSRKNNTKQPKQQNKRASPTPPAPKPVPKPVEAKPNETVTAVHSTEDVLKKLDQKEELILKQIEKETDSAKAAMRGNDKNKALLCMKKKKMLEGRHDTMMKQKFQLETLSMTLQDAAMNQEVAAAQRVARDALARVAVDLQEVDDLMLDLNGLIDDVHAVSEALGQLDNNFCVEDDDTLLAELEEIVPEDDIDTRETHSERVTDNYKTNTAIKDVVVPSEPLPDTEDHVPAEDADLLRNLEKELAA